MSVIKIGIEYKGKFDRVVSHVIQSWEWGEFRQKEGKQVVRIGDFQNNKLTSGFQLTFHKIPYFGSTIGYLPKSDLPSKQVLDYLVKIGKEHNAAFIKLEPEVENLNNSQVKNFINHPRIKKSPKSIFAQNTFIIDLKKSEDELLGAMHPKTRYNIRVAQKHVVTISEKDDQGSFEIFLKLQRQTANRQKFFIHPDSYYKLLWKILRPEKMVHLLIAYYKKEPLVAWLLFRFKNTLYYPYGGSSEKFKNLMASNLMAWEALKLGQRLGCDRFDFWGALGQEPNEYDPWYGFHRFKQGYGGKLVSYIGAYDLVIDPLKYQLFTSLDQLRWIFLRVVKR